MHARAKNQTRYTRTHTHTNTHTKVVCVCVCLIQTNGRLNPCKKNSAANNIYIQLQGAFKNTHLFYRSFNKKSLLKGNHPMIQLPYTKTWCPSETVHDCFFKILFLFQLYLTRFRLFLHHHPLYPRDISKRLKCHWQTLIISASIADKARQKPVQGVQNAYPHNTKVNLAFYETLLKMGPLGTKLNIVFFLKIL